MDEKIRTFCKSTVGVCKISRVWGVRDSSRRRSTGILHAFFG